MFLDFLTTKIKSRLADRESVLDRYVYREAFYLFTLTNLKLTLILLQKCIIIIFLQCFLVFLYRYKDALVLLLREVLNRIQFRYNQAQLEELDDETLDDDVRSF